MRNKILKIIHTFGPLLPVEVSSKVGENSFLVSACLEELVESKQILSSEEKVGTSRLFYTKDQEGKVADKLSMLIIPTKTAATFKKGEVKESPDLAKKRQDFAERLKNIEDKEAQFKHNSKPHSKINPKSNEPTKPDLKIDIQPKSRFPATKAVIKENQKFLPKTNSPLNATKILPREPKIAPSRSKQTANKSFVGQKKPSISNPPYQQSPQPQIPMPKSNPVDESFETLALNYLREKNIQILTEPIEISSKESEVMVSVPSGVGPVKFLVRIKTKKKINRSDLMELYAAALEKRTSAILLTNGKLASTAKLYLKDVGGLLRVKQF